MRHIIPHDLDLLQNPRCICICLIQVSRLTVAAGHHPELCLLEPTGGHEWISWHGGLQVEEKRDWVQRAGPFRCWLVHVPAKGWWLPACPCVRACSWSYWHSPGETQEAAAAYTRSASWTTAIQICYWTGWSRCWPKAEKGTLSGLLPSLAFLRLLPFFFFLVIV